MRFLQLMSCALAIVLAAIVPRESVAQTDVIRGKVTNAEGTVLGNVRVTATSIPGNVTRETRTDAKGSFQIAFPGGAGDYMMGYALVGYVYRQFEIKRTADQDVLVADARMGAVQIDTLTITAPVQQRVGRNSQMQDVSGTERSVSTAAVPVDLAGNIAALAASQPGVLLIPGVDGGADGFSVLGLGADQNSVTLNGMNFGGSGLPRDAQLSASMSTSPYDGSRGGFSGAQLNVRTSGGGSNYATRGVSMVVNTPQLMWTDPAARALGNEYSNYSLGGIASGAFRPNKIFYNTTYELSRRASDNQTLLNAGPLGLNTAGVSSDSVNRFLDILAAGGIPISTGFDPSSRLNYNGSLLTSVDISPPNSTSGSSFGFTLNGNFGRQTPVGGSVTQLASASGERTNWSGGLQMRHNRYFGLILSESNAGVNTSRNYGEPFLDLPSGIVRVNSELANGASGVQSLGFGGNQGLNSRNQSVGASFQNTLSWFDDANKHRVKFGTELQFSGNSSNQANNLRGTYVFNSLEDLAAKRPASFTRMLTSRQRSTGQYMAALSITDSWRKTQDLQIQYSLRVENTQFTARPAYNAEVERIFGVRNSRVPAPIVISPRVGFSYTLGSAQEIGAFTGAVRGPRAVIRGGFGVFSNASNSGNIGSALDNTGLPSGAQQLNCVGAAAPVPDWALYATNPGGIPDRCADGTGGTVFANSAPNVTLFGRNYRPQQSLRSNFSWTGSILDARFNTTVEATYAYNINQSRSVDINFLDAERFTLEGEDGRPVFVQPGSIVRETGAIASRDARVSQSFSRVSEFRSDLASQSAQIMFRISPINRNVPRFTWNAAYTYQNVREKVNGFQSTNGNPLGDEWAQSAQGPHQITYGFRYTLFKLVQVGWNGSFRSGTAYTPGIVGDINGDGYQNDRAFIYAPGSTSDAVFNTAMQQLLDNSRGRARSCLMEQMGRIAERNSCRGPWVATGSMNISIDRVKFRLPNRTSVNLSISNPMGAADLLFNGSGKLRGWGQNITPDASLLYVRGFDAEKRQYRYEVNQRFGATNPQFLAQRSPVTMTLSFKVDLGPTRERQMLQQQFTSTMRESDRRFMESVYRSIGASGIQNPMSTILRSQDSLRLTSLQADSIASMNRRYTYRTDSLWTPVARRFALLDSSYRMGAEYERYIEARHDQIDFMIAVVNALRELLTPAQRRKLPQSINNMLDPQYLRAMRNGNGMYVPFGGTVGFNVGG
ncbi:MAG: carboxypeptidase regulatory-like domain-containing protein [Gemmatimonas sp.]